MSVIPIFLYMNVIKLFKLITQKTRFSVAIINIKISHQISYASSFGVC